MNRAPLDMNRALLRVHSALWAVITSLAPLHVHRAFSLLSLPKALLGT